MGCPAEEKGLCVKCVIEWFISLAGICVLSVGSKLQRGERSLDTFNDVRRVIVWSASPEAAAMPWFQCEHLRSLPVSDVVTSLWGSLFKFHVVNMDTKGPSGTFKRSSLKRSMSGSQKVRPSSLCHIQQVILCQLTESDPNLESFTCLISLEFHVVNFQ